MATKVEKVVVAKVESDYLLHFAWSRLTRSRNWAPESNSFRSYTMGQGTLPLGPPAASVDKGKEYNF